MKFYKMGEFVEQNLDINLANSYKTFEPNTLNKIDYEITNEQHVVLSKIYEKIGGLKNLIDLKLGYEKDFFKIFNTYFIIKESVKSSQIEGTQCTIKDIFAYKSNENLSQYSTDVEWNLNYVKILEQSKDLLNRLPICNQLILKLHKQLMNNTERSDKNIGNFRTTQNWIGPINKRVGLSSATFIPCSCNSLYDHLNELYKFINENDKLDPIVKSGLTHYQFETIHPFTDGNGRVGRTLIILSLMKDEVINGPYISPSFFIKSNQAEYYSLLTNVRVNGEIEKWIDFYLECILKSVSVSFETYKKYIENYFIIKESINNSKNKHTNEFLKILDFSYTKNYFNIDDLGKHLDVAYNSAKKYIELAIELNIIKEWKNNNIGNKKYMNSVLHELIYSDR